MWYCTKSRKLLNHHLGSNSKSNSTYQFQIWGITPPVNTLPSEKSNNSLYFIILDILVCLTSDSHKGHFCVTPPTIVGFHLPTTRYITQSIRQCPVFTTHPWVVPGSKDAAIMGHCTWWTKRWWVPRQEVKKVTQQKKQNAKTIEDV